MSIEELELYFKDKKLPQTVEINKAVRISNVAHFVESHFTVLKNYGINRTFEPFYQRLIDLKNILETDSKEY